MSQSLLIQQKVVEDIYYLGKSYSLLSQSLLIQLEEQQKMIDAFEVILYCLRVFSFNMMNELYCLNEM